MKKFEIVYKQGKYGYGEVVEAKDIPDAINKFKKLEIQYDCLISVEDIKPPV